MTRKRHTEEQIIAALQQAEAGGKTTEICRKLGISQATFYNWRSSMPVWACRNCGNCGSCGKRTAD